MGTAAVKRLVELDLLELVGESGIQATNRGVAYLEFLRQTPLPVQRWVLAEDAA